MKQRIALTLGVACMAYAALASAKVGPDEAGKLGKDSTPVGAEKAGNSDGSIPAWEPAPKHGNLSGEFPHDEKIDAEKPKFTINKGNLAQYEAKLTEGHKFLLKTYDSYKMNVYPTHRQVDYPAEIKDATVKRYHYASHDELRQHLQLFVDAYNYGRRLKTLRGLTPHEFICQTWTKEPERFRLDPSHHIPGPYSCLAAARRADGLGLRPPFPPCAERCART